MFGMKAHASVVASAVGQGSLVESDCRRLRRCAEGEMGTITRRNDSFLAEADGKFILDPGPPVADG